MSIGTIDFLNKSGRTRARLFSTDKKKNPMSVNIFNNSHTHKIKINLILDLKKLSSVTNNILQNLKSDRRLNIRLFYNRSISFY